MRKLAPAALIPTATALALACMAYLWQLPTGRHAVAVFAVGMLIVILGFAWLFFAWACLWFFRDWRD